MLTRLHAQTSSIAEAVYRLLYTACAIRAAALACKEMFSQMTEKEQFEHMKDFDYASLIFHRENASIYPAEYAQNAYYGFFLLARSVGNLLAKSAPEAKSETSQETRLSELALSYLESDYQLEHKNTFLRTKPYSYQLVCALRDFLELQISADPETDYVPFIDQIN